MSDWLIFSLGEEPSEPFEVLRTGRFQHPTTGKIEVTISDLDRAVENFNRWRTMGAEVPVDYDHSFKKTGSSRAAGWLTELVRRGRSLFARASWTPAARAMIERGEYRYFSPEFTARFRDESGEKAEGFTILAGGLTNRPFLRGMTPLALSQEPNPEVARLTAEIAELRGRDDVDPDALELHERVVALMGHSGLTYEQALTETEGSDDG